MYLFLVTPVGKREFNNVWFFKQKSVAYIVIMETPWVHGFEKKEEEKKRVTSAPLIATSRFFGNTPSGRRAVHWAAIGGYVGVLEVLKQRDCQVKALTAGGSTAVHLAADYGNLATVQWLLQVGGVNIGVKNNDGLTAKDLAKQAGHRDIYKYLQSHMTKVSADHIPFL